MTAAEFTQTVTAMNAARVVMDTAHTVLQDTIRTGQPEPVIVAAATASRTAYHQFCNAVKARLAAEKEFLAPLIAAA